MTTQQMNWARSHDWFERSAMRGTNDHVVTVLERGYRRVDGEYVPYSGFLRFDDYKALREWAGY